MCLSDNGDILSDKGSKYYVNQHLENERLSAFMTRNNNNVENSVLS